MKCGMAKQQEPSVEINRNYEGQGEQMERVDHRTNNEIWCKSDKNLSSCDVNKYFSCNCVENMEVTN